MVKTTISLALGEHRVIESEMQEGDPVVKSAVRVMQLLELFDIIQREAVVSEVSALLGFPQSSTSVLLRSLVTVGYLKYNRETRAFSPTTKLSFLGSWITSMASSDDMHQMMENINEATGQCVVLGVRNRLNAQYIHVLQARSAERAFVIKGVMRPLVASSVGYSLLADLSDAEIKRIAIRHNAEAHDDSEKVSLSELIERVETVRRDQCITTSGLVTKGFGMISMPLPLAPQGERLVLGLGGGNRSIEQHHEQYIAIMRKEIDLYCNVAATALGQDRESGAA